MSKFFLAHRLTSGSSSLQIHTCIQGHLEFYSISLHYPIAAIPGSHVPTAASRRTAWNQKQEPKKPFNLLDVSRLRSKLRCLSSCETSLPAIPARHFDILAGSRERDAVTILWSKFVASKCLCCALTAYEIRATGYCFLS